MPVDQLTYNRMVRRGGFQSRPLGTDEDGVEYFWNTYFIPQPDRPEVTSYLNELFRESQNEHVLQSDLRSFKQAHCG